jgi:Fe-S cluster biosynthesis and repair protein YggX
MTDDFPGMVMCAKLGRLAPRLEKPPFPGPLGQRIYETVSAEGYDLWKPHMTILINHYALNPADPDTRIMLRQQMEEFFFGPDAQVSEDWETPEAAGPAQRKK